LNLITKTVQCCTDKMSYINILLVVLSDELMLQEITKSRTTLIILHKAENRKQRSDFIDSASRLRSICIRPSSRATSAMTQHRAFAIAGPSVWNDLLQQLVAILSSRGATLSSSLHCLKTVLFYESCHAESGSEWLTL